MCISKHSQDKCKMLNRNTLGRATRGVLAQAKLEGRLICGLMSAISYLEKTPEDALLCFLPETRPGDATSHMQTVLLQAFCYENYIPVIKVDSAEKLAAHSGITSTNIKSRPMECSCVVITRDLNIPWDVNLNPPLTNGEQTLADFYECTLEEYPTPIIQLPR